MSHTHMLLLVCVCVCECECECLSLLLKTKGPLRSHSSLFGSPLSHLCEGNTKCMNVHTRYTIIVKYEITANEVAFCSKPTV